MRGREGALCSRYVRLTAEPVKPEGDTVTWGRALFHCHVESCSLEGNSYNRWPRERSKMEIKNKVVGALFNGG